MAARNECSLSAYEVLAQHNGLVNGGLALSIQGQFLPPACCYVGFKQAGTLGTQVLFHIAAQILPCELIPRDNIGDAARPYRRTGRPVVRNNSDPSSMQAFNRLSLILTMLTSGLEGLIGHRRMASVHPHVIQDSRFQIPGGKSIQRTGSFCRVSVQFPGDTSPSHQ